MTINTFVVMDDQEHVLARIEGFYPFLNMLPFDPRQLFRSFKDSVKRKALKAAEVSGKPYSVKVQEVIRKRMELEESFIDSLSLDSFAWQLGMRVHAQKDGVLYLKIGRGKELRVKESVRGSW